MVRFKNRYLLVEFVWDQENFVDGELQAFGIKKIVAKSVEENFGSYGIGSIMKSLHVIYWNCNTNLCVIRSPRIHHKFVWNAITFITNINEKKVFLRVLHTGGSIRSLTKVALQMNTEALMILHKKLSKNQEEMEVALPEMMEILDQENE